MTQECYLLVTAPILTVCINVPTTVPAAGIFHHAFVRSTTYSYSVDIPPTWTP